MHIGAARVKQEEEAAKNNGKKKDLRNIEEKNVDKRKSPNQGLYSAKDLTLK